MNDAGRHTAAHDLKGVRIMKGRSPKVEIYPHGKEFALYVNGNYLGTYCKEFINIKLRAWHLPEIEL